MTALLCAKPATASGTSNEQRQQDSEHQIRTKTDVTVHARALLPVPVDLGIVHHQQVDGFISHRHQHTFGFVVVRGIDERSGRVFNRQRVHGQPARSCIGPVQPVESLLSPDEWYSTPDLGHRTDAGN